MWNSSLDSVLLMFLSMSMSHYIFIVRCFLFSLSLFVSPASMKGFQVCTSCYRTAGWVTPGSHTESFEGYNLLVVVLLSFWFFGQISMSIKYVYLPLADFSLLFPSGNWIPWGLQLNGCHQEKCAESWRFWQCFRRWYSSRRQRPQDHAATFSDAFLHDQREIRLL